LHGGGGTREGQRKPVALTARRAQAWWTQEDRFDKLKLSETELLEVRHAPTAIASADASIFKNIMGLSQQREIHKVQEQARYFKWFDKDCNGVITTDEFNHLYLDLQQHGYCHIERTVEECLEDMDTNLDGSISFNEFIDWSLRTHSIREGALSAKAMDSSYRAGQRQKRTVKSEPEEEPEPEPDREVGVRVEEELGRLFDECDANQDGALDPGEMRNALRRVAGGVGGTLTQDNLDDLIVAADTNGDGKVDRVEFTTLSVNFIRLKVGLQKARAMVDACEGASGHLVLLSIS
jgi:Ca2+-binding EF-hand superfamily protein